MRQAARSARLPNAAKRSPAVWKPSAISRLELICALNVAIGDAAHNLRQLAQDTEALAQATQATIEDLDHPLGLLKVQD